MSLSEKFIQEFEQLPEDKKKEVIDFIEFIKVKGQKEIEGYMDNIILENKEALRKLAE
ncbi:MAG: hypothetical protein PHY90_08455 [Desulfitobacteriaceae bacterium]|nr:hypothetical protein [Desulfitobacteriaceae bacterium]